jgi:hypothetical protein
MNRVVTDERMDAAVNYLSDSDDLAAHLMADMERAELRARAVKDALIKHGEGGVGERTAAAGCAPQYTDAMEVYFVAMAAFNCAKNRRSTASLVVDVWRSENAARRQG